MAKKSTSAARPVVDLLGRRLGAATVMFHAAVADRIGVSVTDARCRALLLQAGPMTAGELATHTGLAGASVTSLIDRLEAKKLVKRARDPEDRRRVVVQPVPAGISDRYASPFLSIAASFRSLWESYTDEQLETILDFVQRSSAVTREMTAAMSRKKTS